MPQGVEVQVLSRPPRKDQFVEDIESLVRSLKDEGLIESKDIFGVRYDGAPGPISSGETAQPGILGAIAEVIFIED